MSTFPPHVLSLSSVCKIASHHIGPNPPKPYHSAIELSQATHRINLVNSPAWSPFFSSSNCKSDGLRILELGCGQGTCTAVLASAGAHITAVDPAPLTYGAPYTLGQAQSHLSSGLLGSHITWVRADPVDFLTAASPSTYLSSETDQKWDMAILAHCIWYFPSPDVLSSILAALKGRVKGVLIAEYALHASEKAATPHVLASIVRAAFEAHRQNSTENIQTTVSPVAIKKIAEQAGWKVREEGVVVPEEGLSDGQWEVGTVVHGSFVDGVEKEVEDERVRAMLMAAREAVVAAVDGLGGLEKVRTMDVWVGSLVEE